MANRFQYRIKDLSVLTKHTHTQTHTAILVGIKKWNLAIYDNMDDGIMLSAVSQRRTNAI